MCFGRENCLPTADQTVYARESQAGFPSWEINKVDSDWEGRPYRSINQCPLLVSMKLNFPNRY